MTHTDIQQCPACNSSNLWSHTYENTTYKHCLNCSYVWDVKLEGSDELKTDSSEYASLLDETNYSEFDND